MHNVLTFENLLKVLLLPVCGGFKTDFELCGSGFETRTLSPAQPAQADRAGLAGPGNFSTFNLSLLSPDTFFDSYLSKFVCLHLRI